MRTVEIKYISHNYNVWRTVKAKKGWTMFPRLVRCCSQWLQIVTCSIRDPHAGIRKVPLANETQNKLKRRVSNETGLFQGQLLLQHILGTRQSSEQHQNFPTMKMYTMSSGKNWVFSVELIFFAPRREGIITKKAQKTPTTIPAHFFKNQS